MSRAEFPQPVKRDLAALAGYHCVRCHRRTHLYSVEHGRHLHVGNAAHISAAAPGGPRYEEALTPEQRKAHENGAWLCAWCARLVDVFEREFPPELLREMQASAERRIRGEVFATDPRVQPTPQQVASAVAIFLHRLRDIGFMPWHAVDGRTLQAAHRLISDCAYLAATNPLCAQLPIAVAQQERIVEALRLLCNEIQHGGGWGYSELGQWWLPHNPQQLDAAHASQAQASQERARILWDDVQNAAQFLEPFAMHGGAGGL